MRSDILRNRQILPKAYRGTGSTTRLGRLPLAALLLVGVLGIAGLLSQGRISDTIAPQVTVSLDSGTGARRPTDVTYLNALQPHLAVLMGEGAALQELGNSRSRNVVELAIRMDRYRAAAANIESFMTSHTPPALSTDFVSDLRFHIAESIIAIDGAIAAFRQFDWDALGVSVADFSTAIDRIVILVQEPVQD